MELEGNQCWRLIGLDGYMDGIVNPGILNYNTAAIKLNNRSTPMDFIVGNGQDFWENFVVTM